MRFVHITDTHVGSTPDHIRYDFKPYAHLEALVAYLNNLPFQPDFILHTGDVVDMQAEDAENGTGEAFYQLVKPVLAKLKYPIYYVTGNHDDSKLLQRVLLGKTSVTERLDYQVEIQGEILAVFDTRGPNDPAGTLTDQQLANIRALCTPDGPPLIIAIHHSPLVLDATWLDDGWRTPMGKFLRMPIDRAEEFRAALAPARSRIRGVFFGHVHRGFQVIQDGIFYCAAPSAFVQLESWPDQAEPIPAHHEPPAFNIVTIKGSETIVRQYALNHAE